MEGESRRGREETPEAESSNRGSSIANPSSLPCGSARRRSRRSVENDRSNQAESSSRGRSISNPSSLPRGRSIANPSTLPGRSARRRRSRSRSVDNDRRSQAESSGPGRSARRRRSRSRSVDNDRRSQAESSGPGRRISNPSCLPRRNARRRRSRSRSVDNDRSSVESDRNSRGSQDNDGRRRRRRRTLDNNRSNRSSSRVDGTIISTNQPSSVDAAIIGSNQPNGDNDVSSRRRLTARMSVPRWEYINPSANPATVAQRNYIVSGNAGIEARRTLRQRRQEFILERAHFLEQAQLLIMMIHDQAILPADRAAMQPILPADRAAVQQLPRIIISEEHINNNNDNSTCPICWEKYQVGEEARVMECGHMYHKACIFEWLENQRTCPLCRFEMP